jgi:hypothetical protein
VEKNSGAILSGVCYYQDISSNCFELTSILWTNLFSCMYEKDLFVCFRDILQVREYLLVSAEIFYGFS